MVKKHPITDPNVVAQHVANLVVPHTGPVSRFVVHEIVDRVRAGFGFEEPVLPLAILCHV
jgi:hypothetical protein